MLNNFVNFDFSFTKLLGIDPCEKRINIQGGHAWRHLFMACSKLEAMAIYLVKQACGNDKLACVYVNNYFFRYTPTIAHLVVHHVAWLTKQNKA